VNGRKEAKREAEVPSLECQEIPSWQMSLSNIVQFPEMSDNLSNTAGQQRHPGDHQVQALTAELAVREELSSE
jgi:hypothetical protein